MNILLLTVLCVIEIAFAWISIPRRPKVREWVLARLIINGGEVLVFLVLLLSPGIDLEMRFRLLFLLLGIRTVLAAVLCLTRRKAEKEKKAAGIIFSLFGSVLLFTFGSIPSFLFADYQGLPTTGPYGVGMAQAILVDESRQEAFETDGSNREVPAYFFYPEGGDAGEKYPLIFFSHGAFGYYQSNMSTYMELASHGYVVVSLEHPYHALFTKDTDGEIILTDQTFMRDVQRINGSEATEEDIGAVIDFDGTMFGEIEEVADGVDIIREEPYDTPLLSFDNEAHHESRAVCAEQGVHYANNVVLAHAADGYSTYIAGTGHMNYTDLPLFSPFLASMLGTGDVDAEACILKMNEITLAFFDCYLKESGTFQVEEGYYLLSDGNQAEKEATQQAKQLTLDLVSYQACQGREEP